VADFIGADLRGAWFERTDLTAVQLRAADLTGARFRGGDLDALEAARRADQGRATSAAG
jgi:uncharacterized protein YjbI with pentapeptide repeats